MHILGKILIWLVVLAAGAATYLTTRVLDIRNSWKTTLTQLETANQQDAETIAQKKRELKALQDQYARTTLGWGTYWNQRSGGQNQITGGVLPIGIGTDDGFGTRGNQPLPQGAELPTVHAFRPLQDGSYMYVGEFQAVAINPQSAQVKALWNIRGNETDSWAFSDQWRFRTAVPPKAVTQLVSLHASLTSLDELLADKTRFVAAQTRLLEVADEQLKYRIEELVGGDVAAPVDPNALAEGEKPEYSHGLLAALAYEEEQRNAALLSVDQMRRRLKTSFETLQELVKQNNLLARTLPQPEPAAESTSPVSVNSN